MKKDKSDKIYYNTEYRKKIKALSKFNIYIKDRITKKDIIYEKREKKEKKLNVPLVLIRFPKFYKLIEKLSEKGVYTKKYDLKFFFNFLNFRKYLKSKKNKKNMFLLFYNQLILDYYINGIIYFFLILNGLGISEGNKGISLTDILEHNFFNLNIFFKYISNNFVDFSNFFIKSYEFIYNSFFYYADLLENNINIYNIMALNDMKIFFVLFNVEEIRYEHDKRLTPQKIEKI